MALDLRLTQRLTQQLVMTPQLRQAIKILQVSRAELESLIDQELTEGALWDEKACAIVREMCALGPDVAVAGGLNIDILPRLAGLPVYALVIGRGITGQADPLRAAQAIFERRRELWPA